jgi:hypothetical protein
MEAKNWVSGRTRLGNEHEQPKEDCCAAHLCLVLSQLGFLVQVAGRRQLLMAPVSSALFQLGRILMSVQPSIFSQFSGPTPCPASYGQVAGLC